MNGNLAAQKSKYVVMDEHTLGYRLPKTPHFIGVLAGSVLRGGHNPFNGPAVITPRTHLRPATQFDFESFRLVLPTDFVWEDGGSDAARWNAAQAELDRYRWPAELEVIGRQGWTLWHRQHLQCFVDAAYFTCGGASCTTGRVKLDFHVEFDPAGAVTNAYAFDTHGTLTGCRGDAASRA